MVQQWVIQLHSMMQGKQSDLLGLFSFEVDVGSCGHGLRRHGLKKQYEPTTATSTPLSSAPMLSSSKLVRDGMTNSLYLHPIVSFLSVRISYMYNYYIKLSVLPVLGRRGQCTKLALVQD